MAFQAFGFTFKNDKNGQESDKVRSFAPPETEGALNVAALDAFGTPVAYSMDLEGSASSENRLIEKYRDISMIPEVDRAIEEIVSEAIIGDQVRESVTLNLDGLDMSEGVKNKIKDSFDHVISLLHFKSKGYDIFRRWYIDGRINYHIMIDENSPKKGIKELRFLDPKKIKKIRQVIKEKGSPDSTNVVDKKYIEYYIFNEKGVESAGSNQEMGTQSGVRVAKEAIAHSNSGLQDPKSSMIISFLHKALRAANSLRMMEDAVVIYRLSRAPERRIFYVDVGNLPKGRSEQYMRQIMSKYKNKLVYDATTGDVKDDRRHLAMTEDYWIPRREGSRGTEIETLPGGENLGEMTDIEYFKRKLYEALNVPMSRLGTEPQMFSRGTEITRDEVRFSRFISRLRTRFSTLFDDLLGKHLVLTGVMSWEFWERIKEEVVYDFAQDNYFAEAMQTEIIQQRFGLVNEIQPYIGMMVSKEYVMKKILMMTDEEIAEESERIKKENSEEPVNPEDDGLPKTESVPAEIFDIENEPVLAESDAELSKSMARFFDSMSNQNLELKKGDMFGEPEE